MADEENTTTNVEDQGPEDQEVEERDTGTDEEELSDEERQMAELEEAVEVEAHDIGPLRRKLDISVPRELIDDRMSEQFDELRREAAIPGFRRGRAPLRLVEKRFGHDVGEELSAKLISSAYLAATKKLALNTLGDPMVWASIPEQVSQESGMNKVVVTEKLVSVETALEHLRLPKEGPLTYSCEVELKPEFELPELDGIAIEKPTRTIGDEEVDAEIKRLMAFRGTYQPLEGEKVQADDVVIGHLKVTVDGKTIKTEENAMLAARDQRYSGVQLTGLGDVLIGKKIGDDVNVEVSFPDDHETADLRGKSGRFEFAIQDHKRLVIPELTDELLGELGYESKDDLSATIKDSLEQRSQSEVKEAMRKQVTEYLLSKTEFDLPEGLSQRQTESIVRRRMIEMYQIGLPEAEIGKRVDELRTRAAEEAANDLKLFFVMDKIAEERDIHVSEDEINGAIASIASMQGKRFDRIRDELSKNDGMTSLYIRIRDAKILDALMEKANVTEK